MRFNPSREDELTAYKPWTQGVYDFEILEAEEKVSQRRGNPMIEIKLEITRRDGATKIVRDYLLPQRPDKLLHAARACDVEDKYEEGSLEEGDFLGKRGKLKLGIQRSRHYPTKNVVVDYIYGMEYFVPRASRAGKAAP